MNIEDDAEICLSCGRILGPSERATIVEGKLICFQCGQKLSEAAIAALIKAKKAEQKMSAQGGRESVAAATEDSRVASETRTITSDATVPDEEGIWISWKKASKATIIFAIVIMFIAFLPYINDKMSHSEEQSRQYIESRGVNFCIEYGYPISIFAVGLTLLIRAFLPAISFLRGLAVVIGGFLFYAGILPILVLFYFHGPGNPAAVCGMAVLPLFGLFLLIVGFRLKKNESLKYYSYDEFIKNWEKLKVGDTVDETLSLIGRPSKIQKDRDKTDRWIYETEKKSKISSTIYSHGVLISDNKVVEIIPDPDYKKEKK
jgi:hypothetical protein